MQLFNTAFLADALDLPKSVETPEKRDVGQHDAPVHPPLDSDAQAAGTVGVRKDFPLMAEHTSLWSKAPQEAESPDQQHASAPGSATQRSSGRETSSQPLHRLSHELLWSEAPPSGQSALKGHGGPESSPSMPLSAGYDFDSLVTFAGMGPSTWGGQQQQQQHGDGMQRSTHGRPSEGGSARMAGDEHAGLAQQLLAFQALQQQQQQQLQQQQQQQQLQLQQGLNDYSYTLQQHLATAQYDSLSSSGQHSGGGAPRGSNAGLPQQHVPQPISFGMLSSGGSGGFDTAMSSGQHSGGGAPRGSNAGLPQHVPQPTSFGMHSGGGSGGFDTSTSSGQHLGGGAPRGSNAGLPQQHVPHPISFGMHSGGGSGGFDTSPSSGPLSGGGAPRGSNAGLPQQHVPQPVSFGMHGGRGSGGLGRISLSGQMSLGQPGMGDRYGAVGQPGMDDQFSGLAQLLGGTAAAATLSPAPSLSASALAYTPVSSSGGGSGSGGGGAAAASGNTPGLTAALAQVAAERGLDQGALALLLQNPVVLEMLTTGVAKQQQQHNAPLPRSQLQLQQPSHQQQQMQAGALRRISESGRRSMGGGGGGGGGTPLSLSLSGMSLGVQSSPSLVYTPSQQQQQQQQQQAAAAAATPAQQAQALAELATSRNVLVQLVLSAYAFLNSDSIRGFYDSLAPIAQIYASMHDLPVVQKRRRCAEMAVLRDQLMQEPGFMQILTAICALRHHLYSLSRKVLLLSQQGMDSVPIDLLLGSMSSELFHILKGLLPQEVLDFFSNNLPHPKLSVLVFVEFTKVDPVPMVM